MTIIMGGNGDTSSTRMATKINLQAPKGKKQTNKQASEGNYVVVEEELEQKKKKAHQMTIQVIRSIAELFK